MFESLIDMLIARFNIILIVLLLCILAWVARKQRRPIHRWLAPRSLRIRSRLWWWSAFWTLMYMEHLKSKLKGYTFRGVPSKVLAEVYLELIRRNKSDPTRHSRLIRFVELVWLYREDPGSRNSFARAVYKGSVTIAGPRYTIQIVKALTSRGFIRPGTTAYVRMLEQRAHALAQGVQANYKRHLTHKKYRAARKTMQAHLPPPRKRIRPKGPARERVVRSVKKLQTFRPAA